MSYTPTYNIVQFTKFCRVAMQAKELSSILYEFHRKEGYFSEYNGNDEEYCKITC